MITPLQLKGLILYCKQVKNHTQVRSDTYKRNISVSILFWVWGMQVVVYKRGTPILNMHRVYRPFCELRTAGITITYCNGNSTNIFCIYGKTKRCIL